MLNELISLYEKGNIYGSWLFIGKKGLGKFDIAYNLAKHIINTEYNKTAGAIDSHPALKILRRDITDAEKKEMDKLYSKGEIVSAEDIKNSKKNTSIKIDQIRELISSLRITVGKSRLVIIDSANDLNIDSANSLLKLLEEPPEKTIIILICHNIDTLLPTIKSRCRKLYFSPLKNTEMADFIKKRYPYISSSDIETIVFYADGAKETACNFIENDGLEIWGSFKHIIENFPNIPYSVIKKYVDDLAKNKDEYTIDVFINFILLTLADRCKNNYTEESINYFEKSAKILKDIKPPLNIDLKHSLLSVLSGNV